MIKLSAMGHLIGWKIGKRVLNANPLNCLRSRNAWRRAGTISAYANQAVNEQRVVRQSQSPPERGDLALIHYLLIKSFRSGQYIKPAASVRTDFTASPFRRHLAIIDALIVGSFAA